MPITYGMSLARSWGRPRWTGTVLMKAYTIHTEESDVFLSYRHSDQCTALGLANDLDRQGIRVFIDVHDDTLVPGQEDLDDALVTDIDKSNTMIVIVSDETQGSWWVPWRLAFRRPSANRGPCTSHRPAVYCRLTLRN